jgi:hypothetical protein
LEGTMTKQNEFNQTDQPEKTPPIEEGDHNVDIGFQENDQKTRSKAADIMIDFIDFLDELARKTSEYVKKTAEAVNSRVRQDNSVLDESSSSGSINVNRLGYFLDGWADLIESMGSKVDDVRSIVLQQLQQRNMPNIRISENTGHVGISSSERRHYTITTTSPGATTTIYIGEHGEDLYASWRTYLQPILSWLILVIIFLIALIISVLPLNEANSTRYRYEFTDWLIVFVLAIIIQMLVVAIAGRIFKGRFSAFFIIEPNVFDAEDITAMGLSAHKSILRALDSAGIDVSKLRVKQDFQGGRRGEKV